MSALRWLRTYVSTKLVICIIIMIVMYAFYWPLLLDSNCRIGLFGRPWFSYLWTLLPALTPLMVGWFDQLKRKKETIDLDGISYMLIIINIFDLYGGLTFWSLSTPCSLF